MAGDQKKALDALCTSGRVLGGWEVGGGGEEEPGQGNQGRRGGTAP